MTIYISQLISNNYRFVDESVITDLEQHQPVAQESRFSLRSEEDLHLSPLSDRGVVNCGATISKLKVGTVGYIRSPNYPENYPANIKCVWWLKAVDEGRISMTCNDVLTQNCDDGYYDYVLVAPDWAWEKYYLLCGNYNKFTPFTLASTQNFLSVYFRSSYQKNYRGFQCRYEVLGEITTTPNPAESSSSNEETTTEVEFNGEEGCGVPLEGADRIVGGDQVSPNRYPWMVGLSFDGKWFCGGSLINKDWVLTAAHCTHGAESSYVYIGAHNLYDEEEGRIIVKSDDFYQHPEYDLTDIVNDIALIKLPEGTIPAYTSKIRPVCLPARSRQDLELQEAKFVAVGWGKTDDQASISPVLNELSVNLVTNKVCAQSFGDIIKPTNVCGQGANGTGTCQGDSGSSLQYTTRPGLFIQYGIVSFGASTGCGKGYPNGYSRITEFLDFIGNTVGTVYK